MRRVARIKNPWDQDVALKKALGVPDSVFELVASVLLKTGSAKEKPEIAGESAPDSASKSRP
jgi:hypothetical protein